MISACFFGAMLYSDHSPFRSIIAELETRNFVMGLAMGSTALFIFYSPWTSSSGSHINPAVSLTFLRLNKMCRYDTLFYILFQLAGGIIAVFLMQQLMGKLLIDAPVNSVVTVPVDNKIIPALTIEIIIAFLTMTTVLFTSDSRMLKRYTRPIVACLVCLWVMTAGTVSGFGMNPARSFASALPAGIWTSFWIYLTAPFAGMLMAAEFFVWTQKKKKHHNSKTNPFHS